MPESGSICVDPDSNVFQYISQLLEEKLNEIESRVKRIEDLALSAAAKLGVNDFSGRVYLEKNGRIWRLRIADIWGNRKSVNITNAAMVTKELFYRALERRGLSREEAAALVSYKFMRDRQRLLEKIRYHVNRAIELINELDLDLDVTVDEFINHYNMPRVVVYG